MAEWGKFLAICLVVILAASSLLMIIPVNAQTNPKPSVPQFKIDFTDRSYDVPATVISTTDPYTNKTTIENNPSYHIKNYTLDITIENQPFPSTIDGNKSNLYYYFREKPHYSEKWLVNGFNSTVSFSGLVGAYLTPQSNSNYTIISLGMGDGTDYEVGAQVDYQIQAILGYNYITYEDGYSADSFFPTLGPVNHTAYISASDWSPTQTFVMPNTNPSQTLPNLPILISTISLLLIIFVITLLLYRRSRKQKYNTSVNMQ